MAVYREFVYIVGRRLALCPATASHQQESRGLKGPKQKTETLPSTPRPSRESRRDIRPRTWDQAGPRAQEQGPDPLRATKVIKNLVFLNLGLKKVSKTFCF